MQFINIVVHSVEDMNFRVHLQYDFTKLNLDEHLEVCGHVTSFLMSIYWCVVGPVQSIRNVLNPS